jgi:hypothetical protein
MSDGKFYAGLRRDARLNKLQIKIENLLAIPANEQCIGHLQVALQDILRGLFAEIERSAQ